MVAIAVCCVASIAMSTTHVQYQFGSSSSSSSSSVDSRPSKQQQQQQQQRTHGVEAALSDFHGKQNKENSKEDASLLPFYPKLQCKPYGGPNEKEAQEMVYWQGEFVVIDKCVVQKERSIRLLRGSPKQRLFSMR
jgi:hypothetical protein